jgi:predicted nucleotidyltransferase
MTIESLALYGSRARRDEGADSDIDLFAISGELEYQMIVSGNTNIASYPRALAFKRASDGDLFMLHIVKESLTLYDPSRQMEELKHAFVFKNNYDLDIRYAADIAWLLIDHGKSTDNFTFLNRRIAWCVRTILIARAANEHRAIFSAKGLSEFSKSSVALKLIKAKNLDNFRLESLKELDLFLKSFKLDRVFEQKRPSLEDYLEFFEESKNVMGLKTLSLLASSTEDFYSE